jgi:cytochrome c
MVASLRILSLILAHSVLMSVVGMPAALADAALAERFGCTSCHGGAGQGTGPTYDAIALRYRGVAGAREILSEKVATGGGGNWAEETGGVGMPPYSILLSAEEIQALVDWILAQDG